MDRRYQFRMNISLIFLYNLDNKTQIMTHIMRDIEINYNNIQMEINYNNIQMEIIRTILNIIENKNKLLTKSF